MVWRIGKILDFYDQVVWIKSQGFDSISFHDRPGEPGQWSGFDSAAPTPQQLQRLRSALAGFTDIEINGPFELGYKLSSPDKTVRKETVAAFLPSLQLAQAIGARVR